MGVKIIKKLKEKSGAHMTIMSISLIFLLIGIIGILGTFMQVVSLIVQSRNLIEEATIATIQNNYANVYHTSRESYSGGYIPNSESFDEKYNDDSWLVYNTLVQNLGFEGRNGIYAKIASDGKNTLYYIKNVKVKIKNEQLKSGTKNFIGTTEYTFVLPIKIFNYNKNLEINLKVKAKHTGKF